MRRMSYPRFDKPVNFGTFNADRDVFILDHKPEAGIYVAIIEDEGDNYTVLCTFSDTTNTNACWYGTSWDDMVRLFYTPGSNNEIGSGPHGGLSAGATIKLYKIN